MRKTIAVLAALFSLAVPAAAGQNEYVSPNYDFSKIKTVLIMEPTFAYGGFDVGGKNKFVVYPASTEKITAMLGDRKRNMPHLQFVTLTYVTARVKADPALAEELSDDRKALSALVQREMPKYVDLVLYCDVRDFGWFYEWQEAYYTTKTVIDKVRYHERSSDGKKVSGWMEVPRTVDVYHPAHHKIFDSAEVRFALLDTQTWRNVWQYTDARTRVSFAWSGSYDSTGPESMMGRIFDAAFEKMPVNLREAH